MSLEARCEERDVEALVNELRQLEITETNEGYSWDEPALNVLECVLSLHQRYDRVVKPRLERFEKMNPEVESIEDLMGMMHRLGVIKFLRQELNYNDPAKAKTLAGVVKYLMDVQSEFIGKDEQEKLTKWAVQSTPADHEKVNVDGFGLAGFQYLRMLFGAQTVKPDVHIKRFVSRVTGRKVSDSQALECLELAAKRTGLPIRDADYGIWRKCAGAAD